MLHGHSIPHVHFHHVHVDLVGLKRSMFHHHHHFFLMTCMHGCSSNVEFVNKFALVLDNEANGFTAPDNDFFLVVEIVFHSDSDRAPHIGYLAGCPDFRCTVIMTATMTRTRKGR